MTTNPGAVDTFNRENWFNHAMHQWHPDLIDHTWNLHATLDQPTQLRDDGGGHKNRGTRPGTRAPWNQPAAHMFFDIHAEIRRLEPLLTLTLHHRAVYRGGSDHATQQILDRLPTLLRALRDHDLHHPALDETLTTLISLTRRSHALLHPEQRRTRAPFVTCHECGGDLWIHRDGDTLTPRLQGNDHFQPGDAYCNPCGVFYPQDIWHRVARDNAQSPATPTRA